MQYENITDTGGGPYQDRTRTMFLKTDATLEEATAKVKEDHPHYRQGYQSLPVQYFKIRAVDGGYKINLITPYTG